MLSDQDFPSVFVTWARMLRCLVEPGLQILRSRTVPTDYEVFYSSELVGNVERLLIEMFSGNVCLVPTQYWRILGVMHGIYEGSFPSFDKVAFDLERKEADLSRWPRDEDGALMFIQEPGLRYHFSKQVVGLQKALLSRCVRAECISRMTRSEILEQGKKAIVRAMMEWRMAVVNTMEVELERALGRLSRLVAPDRDERLGELKEASDLIQDNPGIFEAR